MHNLNFSITYPQFKFQYNCLLFGHHNLCSELHEPFLFFKNPLRLTPTNFSFFQNILPAVAGSGFLKYDRYNRIQEADLQIQMNSRRKVNQPKSHQQQCDILMTFSFHIVKFCYIHSVADYSAGVGLVGSLYDCSLKDIIVSHANRFILKQKKQIFYSAPYFAPSTGEIPYLRDFQFVVFWILNKQDKDE